MDVAQRARVTVVHDRDEVQSFVSPLLNIGPGFRDLLLALVAEERMLTGDGVCELQRTTVNQRISAVVSTQFIPPGRARRRSTRAVRSSRDGMCTAPA